LRICRGHLRVRGSTLFGSILVIIVCGCQISRPIVPLKASRFYFLTSIDEMGARFVITAPERFFQVPSKIRGEILFGSSSDEELRISFVSNETPGLKKLNEEIFDAKKAEITVGVNGSKTVFRMESKSGKRSAGYAVWSMGTSGAGITLKSNENMIKIRKELEIMSKTIWFDKNIQDLKELKKLFGSDLKECYYR
jgi:hypothetical protein